MELIFPDNPLNSKKETSGMSEGTVLVDFNFVNERQTWSAEGNYVDGGNRNFLWDICQFLSESAD